MLFIFSYSMNTFVAIYVFAVKVSFVELQEF